MKFRATDLGAAALLAMTLLLTRPSFGGEGADSSGGGLGVVCFDTPGITEGLRRGDGLLSDELLPHVESIENFDLYEAKLLRGLEPTFRQELIPIKPAETAAQYAARILKRLEHSVPSLYRQLETTRAELAADGATSHVSRPLARMNDARQLGLIDYQRCMLATMGLNQLESASGRVEPRLEIDDRLWRHAAQNEHSRGVFLLHEIVYVTARKLGHTDSRHTRTLINMLITRTEQLGVAQLIEKLAEFGFSPKGRKLSSYAEELLTPLIRRALSIAHDEVVRSLPAAAELVARLNTMLATHRLACDGRRLADCLNGVRTLRKTELEPVEKELAAFIDARATRVRDALYAFYEGEGHRARILADKGLATPRARHWTDRVMREDTLDQIALQFTDSITLQGARVITDIEDLDAAARRLAAHVNIFVDYLVEVVE